MGLRVVSEYKYSQSVELYDVSVNCWGQSKRPKLNFTHIHTHTAICPPMFPLYPLFWELDKDTKASNSNLSSISSHKWTTDSTMSFWSKWHSWGRRGLFLTWHFHPIMHSRMQIKMSTPCFMHFFPPQRQCKINTGCAVTPTAQNLINCHKSQFLGQVTIKLKDKTTSTSHTKLQSTAICSFIGIPQNP